MLSFACSSSQGVSARRRCSSREDELIVVDRPARDARELGEEHAARAPSAPAARPSSSSRAGRRSAFGPSSRYSPIRRLIPPVPEARPSSSRSTAAPALQSIPSSVRLHAGHRKEPRSRGSSPVSATADGATGSRPHHRPSRLIRSRHDRARQPVARPRPRLPRAVHGRARRDDRERRAADDPAGPRHDGHQPAVDRQRLHADVRRLPPARRPRRRPRRPQEGLPRRRRPLHRRLAPLRARAGRDLADHDPRPAGARGGARLAGRARRS